MMAALAKHPDIFQTARELSGRLAGLGSVKAWAAITAVTVHAALIWAALAAWPSHAPLAKPLPRQITLSWVTPAVREAPAVSQSSGPAQATTAAQEAPAEPVRPEAEVSPAAPDSTRRSAESPYPARSAEILTAEGGRAGAAPEASSSGAALRSVLCSSSSEHTRAAAGCGAPLDDAARAYAAYAIPDAVAQVDRLFAFDHTSAGLEPSTVDLSTVTLPGQLNNAHSHYVSGAHDAFGRLPVADKARDPGFGN